MFSSEFCVIFKKNFFIEHFLWLLLDQCFQFALATLSHLYPAKYFAKIVNSETY